MYGFSYEQIYFITLLGGFASLFVISSLIVITLSVQIFWDILDIILHITEKLVLKFTSKFEKIKREIKKRTVSILDNKEIN